MPVRRWVLGDELSRKRLLQDALAQTLGPRDAGLDRDFGLLDDRQAAIYLCDDAALLGVRRKRQQKNLDA